MNLPRFLREETPKSCLSPIHYKQKKNQISDFLFLFLQVSQTFNQKLRYNEKYIKYHNKLSKTGCRLGQKFYKCQLRMRTFVLKLCHELNCVLSSVYLEFFHLLQ